MSELSKATKKSQEEHDLQFRFINKLNELVFRAKAEQYLSLGSAFGMRSGVLVDILCVLDHRQVIIECKHTLNMVKLQYAIGQLEVRGIARPDAGLWLYTDQPPSLQVIDMLASLGIGVRSENTSLLYVEPEFSDGDGFY